MILLSKLIDWFLPALRQKYGACLLPSHEKALAAMGNCRTANSPVLVVECGDCGNKEVLPHSCGHRSCPHCQHHESQQWLDRQLKEEPISAHRKIDPTPNPKLISTLGLSSSWGPPQATQPSARPSVAALAITIISIRLRPRCRGQHGSSGLAKCSARERSRACVAMAAHPQDSRGHLAEFADGFGVG